MADGSKGKVRFRGRLVVEGWPEKVEQAQLMSCYEIDGVSFDRIRFGLESWRPSKPMRECGDCAALPGELHVPGCDAEECPRCHEQAFCCDCAHPETIQH